MRYFVYVIQDTSVEDSIIYQIGDHIIQLNYKPIYIGRVYSDSHLNYVKESHNTKVKEFIKKNHNNYIIEKIIIDLSWSDSVLIEQNLISNIGRLDLGKGPLFNDSSEIHWTEDELISNITPLNLELNKVNLVLKRLNSIPNRKLVAESLGISERTLYRLIKRYKIKSIKIGCKKYQFYQN